MGVYFKKIYKKLALLFMGNAIFLPQSIIIYLFLGIKSIILCSGSEETTLLSVERGCLTNIKRQVLNSLLCTRKETVLETVTPISTSLKTHESTSVNSKFSMIDRFVHDYDDVFLMLIAEFLDDNDIMHLRSVNHALYFRFSDQYWEKRIKEQGYIIWDNVLPMQHIYLGNLYYEQGFGLPPQDSPPKPQSRKHILKPKLEKKASIANTLGFPRAKFLWKQYEHLLFINTQERLHSGRENTYSNVIYYYSFFPAVA